MLTILHSEIKIILRQAFAWLVPLLFFAMIVTLFPLALGADTAFLKKMAPGIIWVTALLAVLLSLQSQFRQDEQEGYLDLYLLSHHSLILLVLYKNLSHWVTHCLPLIMISPLLGLLLGLDSSEELALVLTLLLGTPVMILMGTLGSALVINVRNQGLLLPILILPFYCPVLIFGTGTLIAASQHLPLTGYFAIMGALFLLSLGSAPLLTAVALRMGVNQ